MARTIVQEYGPIYGEVVNGTVMGRPNGSVYVPISNTIALSIEDDYKYFRYKNVNRLTICNSSGTAVAGHGWSVNANAQDLASNIRLEIYSDEDMETLAAYRNITAGVFHIVNNADVYGAIEGLTDGAPLYVVAKLMNNSTPVATSEVIICDMVVP